jgi:cytochrome c peroxidase
LPAAEAQRAGPLAEEAGFGPVAPVVAARAGNPALVELGRRLFHDPRLSRDDSVSCASCHPIDRGGVDHLPVSTGIGGRQGELNAPTVLNSGGNFRQFWDGRAATLEEQAAGPVHNPAEMDSNWADAVRKLSAAPEYRELVRQALGRPLDGDGIGRAIAAFERTLTTPDAPFDRYLRGDAAAIGDQAKRGWQLFRDLGCIACHQGVNLGGNMYATLGMMGDFFADRPVRKGDLGRYNVTGREADRHLFKVPGLRNVAVTAPYFHDGSVPTLERAVELMARFQLGIEIAAADRDAIVAFLTTLSGRMPDVRS